MPTRVSWDALAMCGARVTVDSGQQTRVDLGLVLEDIEAGPADPMLRERSHQRRLVHDRTASGVDQGGGLLHQPERALVDGCRVSGLSSA
jgi:hypothetical protein